MRLDQLYFGRPVAGYADYSTPIKNLFVCGSGAHPGLFLSCLPVVFFCLLTVIELIEDLLLCRRGSDGCGRTKLCFESAATSGEAEEKLILDDKK